LFRLLGWYETRSNVGVSRDHIRPNRQQVFESIPCEVHALGMRAEVGFYLE